VSESGFAGFEDLRDWAEAPVVKLIFIRWLKPTAKDK